MKITDVTLTLFAWESIPSTIYGHHTARPTGKSDLGSLAVNTDEGVTGHAFLGTSSNPASQDGPGLIRFLKPILIGQNPLDRERLNRLLWGRARAATVRAIGACDIALWDIAGKAADLPIHRLIGTTRDSIAAYASSEIHAAPSAYVEQARHYQSTGWRAYKIHPPQSWRDDIKVCEAVRKAVGDDYTVMLDSTWSYRYEEALRVGRAIEEMGFYWYEDPLADQDIYNYVKLKQKLDIPILATEYPIGGLDAYVPWILERATDFLHGDVAVKRGHHDPGQDRPSRRSLPHEFRGAPRRKFIEQRRQPARDHGDPEHRIFRGAVAGRNAEIRSCRRYYRRPRRPRSRAHCARSRRPNRLRPDREEEGRSAELVHSIRHMIHSCSCRRRILPRPYPEQLNHLIGSEH
jgi:L-alanine-DL-glutamate epimerase-like enolase superfamily enzyme